MTDQEMFDFVATHLRTQGRPASNSNGDCKYRILLDEQMYKCAAGCLIPDEKYNIDMEGRSIGVLGIPGLSDSGLLKKLQIVHDYAALRYRREQAAAEIYKAMSSLGGSSWSVSTPGWLDRVEKGLEVVAREFNLEYQCPT